MKKKSFQRKNKVSESAEKKNKLSWEYEKKVGI